MYLLFNLFTKEMHATARKKITLSKIFVSFLYNLLVPRRKQAYVHTLNLIPFDFATFFYQACTWTGPFLDGLIAATPVMPLPATKALTS